MEMPLQELQRAFGYRGKAFIDYAISKGYQRADVNKFLKTIPKDKHAIDQSRWYLPIYSKTGDAYQFDTFVQPKGSNPPYYLMIIAVNSRYGYAYPMHDKGSKAVEDVLRMFCSLVHPLTLYSDRDKAYLSDRVLSLLKSKGIVYHTTEEHNHNVLGIVNRYIRTIRDLAADSPVISTSAMKKILNNYNNEAIHSSIGKTPATFTKEDEAKYIEEQDEHTSKILSDPLFDLSKGTRVRVIISKDPLKKRRSTLSQVHYIVDQRQGQGFTIKAADSSTAWYPRHQLVRVADQRSRADQSGPLAKTIDAAQRGFVEEIVDYDPKTCKYAVHFEGEDATHHILPSALRESSPNSISLMERRWWKGKSLPKNKYFT